MDAITIWGELLIEDPARVGATSAIGVDETSFLAATATEGTRWVSGALRGPECGGGPTPGG